MRIGSSISTASPPSSIVRFRRVPSMQLRVRATWFTRRPRSALWLQSMRLLRQSGSLAPTGGSSRSRHRPSRRCAATARQMAQRSERGSRAADLCAGRVIVSSGTGTGASCFGTDEGFRKPLMSEPRRNASVPPDSASRTGSPTYNPPPPSGLSSVLQRNIQSLKDRRLREEAGASGQERIADAITRFTGSMLFVYLHLAVFGFWIVAKSRLGSGRSQMGRLLCRSCDDGTCRGDLSFDLRAHQSKPHGSSRRQASGS